MNRAIHGLTEEEKARAREVTGKVKLGAYERPTCRVCGQELEHKETGRAKEFCSGKCRVKYHRAVKKWVKASVEASLAGQPEPSHPYPWKCNETHQAGEE